MELAKTYLECKEPKLSLKCLSYAKEFQLSAQLCERLGKVRPGPWLLLGERGSPWVDWGVGRPASACFRKGLQSSEVGEVGPVGSRVALLPPLVQELRQLQKLTKFPCVWNVCVRVYGDV